MNLSDQLITSSHDLYKYECGIDLGYEAVKAKDFSTAKLSGVKFNLSWEETATYLVDARGYSSKKSSLSADKSRFKAIKKWFLGKEWNERNFLGLVTHLKKLGRKQGTINKYITMGRNLDLFLNTNVTRLVKSKKEKLPEIKDVLSAAEIKQLVNVRIDYSRNNDFINSRQKALIAFISLTGCRIGEALDLTWHYVYSTPQTYVRFTDTKNGESRDSIINQELYEEIASLARRSKYVFCSFKGNRLSSQVVSQDLKRRSKKVNIKKNVYPHLFRHSLVTELSEKGIPDSDICKIVGWKDQRMMMRYKNSSLDHYDSVLNKHPLYSGIFHES